MRARVCVCVCVCVHQTPDGTTHNSTDFNNGNFRLLLDNPVKGGNYTCRIPSQHLADACLRSNTTRQGEATLFVDKVDARLTLLEKENEQLKQENSVLKNSMDARFQTAAQELKTKYQLLKDENSVLRNSTDARLSQLQTEDQQLSHRIERIESTSLRKF